MGPRLSKSGILIWTIRHWSWLTALMSPSTLVCPVFSRPLEIFAPGKKRFLLFFFFFSFFAWHLCISHLCTVWLMQVETVSGHVTSQFPQCLFLFLRSASWDFSPRGLKGVVTVQPNCRKGFFPNLFSPAWFCPPAAGDSLDDFVTSPYRAGQGRRPVIFHTDVPHLSLTAFLPRP